MASSNVGHQPLIHESSRPELNQGVETMNRRWKPAPKHAPQKFWLFPEFLDSGFVGQ
jgi:hypothetical protein